ncbi:MAG: hypothetical protein AAGJ52_13480 [Pseudomonadota bacterium]
MPDGFSGAPPEALTTPATRAVEITASASAFNATRGIHCSVAETITVEFVDSPTAVDLVVAAGATYPYRIVKVTTGTGVVALY